MRVTARGGDGGASRLDSTGARRALFGPLILGAAAVLGASFLLGCGGRPPKTSRAAQLSDDLLKDPELRTYETMLFRLRTRSGKEVDEKVLAFARIDVSPDELYELYHTFADRSPEEVFASLLGPVPPRETTDCKMLVPLPRLGVELPHSAPADGAGLTVVKVFPGSPAAAAGLTAGDTLRSVDGVALRTTPQLTEHLEKTGVYNTVRLEIERDGAPMTFGIRLDPVPFPFFQHQGGGCEDGLAHGLARIRADYGTGGKEVYEVLARFERGLFKEGLKWLVVAGGKPTVAPVVELLSLDDHYNSTGKVVWRPPGELIFVDTSSRPYKAAVLRLAKTKKGSLPYIHYAGEIAGNPEAGDAQEVSRASRPSGFGIETRSTWPKPRKGARHATGRSWHVGTFRDGNPHGRGSRSWKSEMGSHHATTGFYRDGVKHGPHKWEYRSPKLKRKHVQKYDVAMYEGGRRHGKRLLFQRYNNKQFDIFEEVYERDGRVARRIVRKAKRSKGLGDFAGKAMAIAGGAAVASSANLSAAETASFMASYSADVLNNTDGEHTRKWAADAQKRREAEREIERQAREIEERQRKEAEARRRRQLEAREREQAAERQRRQADAETEAAEKDRRGGAAGPGAGEAAGDDAAARPGETAEAAGREAREGSEGAPGADAREGGGNPGGEAREGEEANGAETREEGEGTSGEQRPGSEEPEGPRLVKVAEGIAYCQPARSNKERSKEELWNCDGPFQKTREGHKPLLGAAHRSCSSAWKKEAARERPFRDGYLVYCGGPALGPNHQRDIAGTYSVPDRLLLERKIFECREDGISSHACK